MVLTQLAALDEEPNVVREMAVFSGNAHRSLAEDVARHLEIPLGECDVFEFANEEIFVKFLDNLRERDVFLIQPIVSPVNTRLMELLIMIDAAKRASAGRITAVIPYYAYGRSDKKDQPRIPITARLLANFIESAGADRVLTVDLHAGQIQGFFNIPVDELTALPMLTDYFKEKEIDDLVVVAVDIGISKKARDVADRLHAPLAIIEKRRIGNDEHTETMNVIGDVKGKVALTFDDEIATGGTIINAARALAEHGVKEVYCCVTHPILSGNASEVIAQSNFTEVVVTDTIPVAPEKRNGKITVLSVAPLLGEAIYRIHNGLSVGDMFNT